MKFLKWLDKYIEIVFIIIALILICIVMSAQIIARKFLGFSIAWSEEFSRHLFICMGFWGISLSIREDSAIRFDLILSNLSDKYKKIFNIISNFINFLFFSYILIPAITVTKQMNNTMFTIVSYSASLLYGIVTIGIILTVIRSMQMILINIKGLSALNKSKETGNKIQVLTKS